MGWCTSRSSQRVVLLNGHALSVAEGGHHRGVAVAHRLLTASSGQQRLLLLLLLHASSKVLLHEAVMESHWYAKWC